jgi:hypothetical protein
MNTDSCAASINQWTTTFLASIHRWAGAPDGLGQIAGAIIKTWVYQIEPLPYLRDHISLAMLASSLETDLGL